MLRAAAGCVLPAERANAAAESPVAVCRAKRSVERKAAHLAPIARGEKRVPISGQAISHQGYGPGDRRNGAFVRREGSLYVACTAVARICLACSRLRLGSSEVAGGLETELFDQAKKEQLEGFVRLVSYSVMGIWFLVWGGWFFVFFGSDLRSSWSTMTLPTWEFFFHGHAF